MNAISRNHSINGRIHSQVSKTLDDKDVTYSLVCDTWLNAPGRSEKRCNKNSLVMIDYLGLVVWNIIFFIFSEELGIEPSQLTNSYFSEGWRKTSSQWFFSGANCCIARSSSGWRNWIFSIVWNEGDTRIPINQQDFMGWCVSTYWLLVIFVPLIIRMAIRKSTCWPTQPVWLYVFVCPNTSKYVQFWDVFNPECVASMAWHVRR